MSGVTVPPVVQSAVAQEFSVLQALSAHYLAGKTLSAPVLMSLAAALSAEVNNVKGLSSADKKKLVCDIVDLSLQNALSVTNASIGSPAITAEEQIALNYVSKNVIPTSVDLLVAASRGKLNLNAVASKGWADCMSCTPAAIAQIRGPAWDIAEKFATAAVASAEAAKGGSIADIAKAAVSGGVVAAAAEAEAKIQAITKVTDLSGVVVDLSGAVVDLSGVVVDLSGAVVDLSGAVVDLSGVVVDVSGVVVDVSGASVPAGALPPAVYQ